MDVYAISSKFTSNIKPHKPPNANRALMGRSKPASPGSVLCFDKTQHQCIIQPIELSRHVEDSVQINKVNLCIK